MLRIASLICNNRSISLLRSLIDEFFFAVSCLCGKGSKRSLFHYVHFTFEYFTKFTPHTGIPEQSYRLAVVKFDKKINITVLIGLTSGIRAKEPGLCHRLGFEIVCHSPYHSLYGHRYSCLLRSQVSGFVRLED